MLHLNMIYFDYYGFFCVTHFFVPKVSASLAFTLVKAMYSIWKFCDGDMGIYFIIINYSLFMLQIFFCLRQYLIKNN